jgi:hypothetical protein
MVNQQVTGTCVFINYEDQTIPRLGCWAVQWSGRTSYRSSLSRRQLAALRRQRLPVDHIKSSLALSTSVTETISNP